MTGRIVSTKMQKTAVVLITLHKKHKLYNKTFIESKKYLADDQIGVSEGDLVEIEKTKPISKRKHWKIIKVLGHSLKEVAKEKLKEEAAQVIGEVMPEEKVEEKPENKEGK